MIQSLLQWLDELDGRLLLAVNGCTTPSLDLFFSTITGRFFWLPAYVLLAAFLVRRYGKGFLYVALFIALAIVLSDQVTSSLLKPMVARLRPCHDPRWSSLLHLVDGRCGGTYGFVSSHASNTFALAAFVWKVPGSGVRALSLSVLVWAVLVSSSRIYLGVHYPGDVLCGALIGSVIGSVLGGYCKRILLRSDSLKLNSVQ